MEETKASKEATDRMKRNAAATASEVEGLTRTRDKLQQELTTVQSVSGTPPILTHSILT